MRAGHLIAIALTLASVGSAEAWPRFRGPNGSGVSKGLRPPVHFGPASNLVWKTEAPKGSSSPIIVAGRVFLTGYDGNRRLVQCFEFGSGRRLWERSLEAGRVEKKSPPNDPASSTPVADENNVYALFSEFGLVAYSRGGAERWRTPLEPFTQPHGMAASPILVNGLVVVLADQVTNSYLAAFDTATGKQKWKVARPNFIGGYSTPLLIGTDIVVNGPVELTAYAADSGERHWSVSCMGVMPSAVPCATAIAFSSTTTLSRPSNR
jgi:outer membrane protein assembly factor BamB